MRHPRVTRYLALTTPSPLLQKEGESETRDLPRNLFPRLRRLLDLSLLAWGLGGGVLIALVFYLLQALGMQSWSAPLDFFADNWELVSPLILLFATQAGLFGAIHTKRHPGGGAVVATSGGMSAGAMFACCLHNLVFLFPILGAAGIAAFFADYQTEVFLASIAFSFLGTLVLLFTLRSHSASCHTTHS